MNSQCCEHKHSSIVPEWKVSGFAKTLVFLAPMCTFSPVLLCDGTGAGTHTTRRKSKGHLLPRTQLKHLGDLFPESPSFAPEAAAGRLAACTAPKEGGEGHRNCLTSCPSCGQQQMPGTRVPEPAQYGPLRDWYPPWHMVSCKLYEQKLCLKALR